MGGRSRRALNITPKHAIVFFFARADFPRLQQSIRYKMKRSRGFFSPFFFRPVPLPVCTHHVTAPRNRYPPVTTHRRNVRCLRTISRRVADLAANCPIRAVVSSRAFRSFERRCFLPDIGVWSAPLRRLGLTPGGHLSGKVTSSADETPHSAPSRRPEPRQPATIG